MWVRPSASRSPRVARSVRRNSHSSSSNSVRQLCIDPGTLGTPMPRRRSTYSYEGWRTSAMSSHLTVSDRPAMRSAASQASFRTAADRWSSSAAAVELGHHGVEVVEVEARLADHPPVWPDLVQPERGDLGPVHCAVAERTRDPDHGEPLAAGGDERSLEAPLVEAEHCAVHGHGVARRHPQAVPVVDVLEVRREAGNEGVPVGRVGGRHLPERGRPRRVGDRLRSTAWPPNGRRARRRRRRADRRRTRPHGRPGRRPRPR